MAMTQVSTIPSAQMRRSNCKKRHHVPLQKQHEAEDGSDHSSVSVSNHKTAAADKPEEVAGIIESTRTMRSNSILSQPPSPEREAAGSHLCAASAITTTTTTTPTFSKTNVTCSSAIGAFLQHLKQTASVDRIEIVSDNFRGSEVLPKAPLSSSSSPKPPLSRHNSHRNTKMSAAEKKNVRWDTHSSTYKVAAAAAAAAASSNANEDESYLQPLSGGTTTTMNPTSTLNQPQRRSSAAAPTCPKRRTSEEDCSHAAVNDEDIDNSDHINTAESKDYTEELRKLREQIAQEEAHLQSVVANVRSVNVVDNKGSEDSPQKPERRSSVMSIADHHSHLQQSSPRLLEEDGVFDISESSYSTQSHSCGELPSPTQRTFLAGSAAATTSMSTRLPDYKLALNAVAQRYATGPRPVSGRGSLSGFRSASTGVLPSATASRRRESRSKGNNDRPLGIPRRRESADIATLCVLDEAATLLESPRGTVV